MNKKLTALLLPLMMLTSCANSIDCLLQYGNGKIPDDAIGVSYQIQDEMTDGYEMKGYAFAEKDAPLSDLTFFSFVDQDPFKGSYNEQTLITFRKSDFTKKDDGTYRMDFVAKFTKLSDYFEETKEEKTLNFFIHGQDMIANDITTYSTSRFNYTFDGKTVKISY